MSTNSPSLGFSIMGTPNGFQSVSFGIQDEARIASQVDLNNSVINLLPDGEALMGKRGRNPTAGTEYYFARYNFATEMDSTRSGAYFGSVVVLKNAKAPSDLILRTLADLSEIVCENCIDSNGKFRRPINGLLFRTPDSLRALSACLEPIRNDPSLAHNKAAFIPVGTELSSYEEFIERFYSDPDLADFRTIYCSMDARIEKIVIKKGQIPVLNLFELAQSRTAAEERKARQKGWKREEERPVTILQEREKESSAFSEDGNPEFGEGPGYVSELPKRRFSDRGDQELKIGTSVALGTALLSLILSVYGLFRDPSPRIESSKNPRDQVQTLPESPTNTEQRPELLSNQTNTDVTTDGRSPNGAPIPDDHRPRAAKPPQGRTSKQPDPPIKKKNPKPIDAKPAVAEPPKADSKSAEKKP